MTDDVHKFMITFKNRIPDSEIFMVGGCVRDYIMDDANNPPSDYDFATNIPIDVIEKHFICNNIGKSKDFGIVNVVFDGNAYEVCQYRSDSGYTNNRHPDEVMLGVTAFEDSKRRDFTINAMFMDVDGNITDFHGGIDDIELDKVIKTVGVADERIKEDSLRILRAIRFSAKFGFRIDDSLIKAIIHNKYDILNLSQERITGEILKTAKYGGKVFFKFFSILESLELMEIVFPEIYELKNYTQWYLHHPEGALMKDASGVISPLNLDDIDAGTHTVHSCGTVYDHVKSSLATLDDDANEFLIMSVLYHDIGKGTVAEQQNKCDFVTYSFKRHEYVGVRRFKEIAEHRKIGGTLRNCIEFCIAEHMNMNNRKLSKKSKILDLALNPFFDILVECSRADDASRNVGGNRIYDKDKFNDNLKKYIIAKNTYTDQQALKAKIDKFINGNKVMNICDIKPSRTVGLIMDEVVDSIINSDFETTIEEVNDMIKSLGDKYSTK
jgi:tRNA nucleotidyltransferase/poly(A) polymerase